MNNHVSNHKFTKAIEIIESSYKYLDSNEDCNILKNVVFSIKKKVEILNKYNYLLDINWEERRAFRAFCVKCIMIHTQKGKVEVNKITSQIKWSDDLISCYVSALRKRTSSPTFLFKEIKNSIKIQMIEEYEKQRVN